MAAQTACWAFLLSAAIAPGLSAKAHYHLALGQSQGFNPRWSLQNVTLGPITHSVTRWKSKKNRGRWLPKIPSTCLRWARGVECNGFSYPHRPFKNKYPKRDKHTGKKAELDPPSCLLTTREDEEELLLPDWNEWGGYVDHLIRSWRKRAIKTKSKRDGKPLRIVMSGDSCFARLIAAVQKELTGISCKTTRLLTGYCTKGLWFGKDNDGLPECTSCNFCRSNFCQDQRPSWMEEARGVMKVNVSSKGFKCDQYRQYLPKQGYCGCQRCGSCKWSHMQCYGAGNKKPLLDLEFLSSTFGKDTHTRAFGKATTQESIVEYIRRNPADLVIFGVGVHHSTDLAYTADLYREAIEHSFTAYSTLATPQTEVTFMTTTIFNNPKASPECIEMNRIAMPGMAKKYPKIRIFPAHVWQYAMTIPQSTQMLVDNVHFIPSVYAYMVMGLLDWNMAEWWGNATSCSSIPPGFPEDPPL